MLKVKDEPRELCERGSAFALSIPDAYTYPNSRPNPKWYLITTDYTTNDYIQEDVFKSLFVIDSPFKTDLLDHYNCSNRVPYFCLLVYNNQESFSGKLSQCHQELQGQQGECVTHFKFQFESCYLTI